MGSDSGEKYIRKLWEQAQDTLKNELEGEYTNILKNNVPNERIKLLQELLTKINTSKIDKKSSYFKDFIFKITQSISDSLPLSVEKSLKLLHNDLEIMAQIIT
jgi:hypothetical protein